jgi:hypothetical protein
MYHEERTLICRPLTLVLSVVLFGHCIASPSLPSFTFSGSVVVNHTAGSSLFYTYYEAETDDGTSEDDRPIILWLQVILNFFRDRGISRTLVHLVYFAACRGTPVASN